MDQKLDGVRVLKEKQLSCGENIIRTQCTNHEICTHLPISTSAFISKLLSSSLW